MKRTAIIHLIILAGFVRAASPPMARHSWNADPSDARPASFRIPHGSAALLEARVPAAPAAASFHWQTNGMGALWWEAPAEASTGAVSVVWTPEMDTGADDVRAFFRIDQEAGPDYSAFANLRLLTSPGAVPNALPLPARTLDFDAVAVTNAPWATPEDVAMAAADAELGAVADVTNYVAEAVAELGADDPAAELHRLILADLWRRVDALEGSDGTGYVTARAVESLVADRVVSEIAAERDSWTATNSIFQTDTLAEIATDAETGVSVALEPNRAVRYYANGEGAAFGIASFSGVGTHPCILILQGYEFVEWPSGAHVAAGYDGTGGEDNVFRVYKLHGTVIVERIRP